MSIATDRLLTADEFLAMPDPGHPTELVRGKVIAMPPPTRRHGQVCANIAFEIQTYTRPLRLGHVVTNDSAVVTERGPDSVRGADVGYYSPARFPPGPLPEAFPEVVPELVFEVLSPSDRWTNVYAKVAEYLNAGVILVAVADPKTSRVHLYRADEGVVVIGLDDEFTAPEILGAFRVPVSRFSL